MNFVFLYILNFFFFYSLLVIVCVTTFTCLKTLMTTSLICIWTSNSIRLPYDFTILTPKAHPRCVQIQKAWLVGIVPVVMDCESTVQEKALECLDQLLLQNIKHYNKFHSGDDSQVLAWALLALLSTESQELRYVNYITCLPYRRVE